MAHAQSAPQVLVLFFLVMTSYLGMKINLLVQLKPKFVVAGEARREIWRVLENGGRFYAVTPAYPSLSAFQDPTHVNFITKHTHDYFCGHSPDAVIYGFKGKFNVIRAEFVIFSESLIAKKPRGMAEWRRYRRDKLGRLSHFLWELEAVK